MKIGQLVLMIFSSFLASAKDLETVPFVDVTKYVGTWYQIARNPLIFEGNCFCSRQILGLTDNGRASVYNSCNEGSVQGPVREIRGFASVDDPVSNAKFTVDFNLPHKGTYWIIGLDQEYRYAVVSDARQKSLYILSRTPILDPTLLDQALAEAAQKLDATRPTMTVQNGCTYP